jgi:uncharacterized protein
LREEITRLMSLQTIDRELRELQNSLATIAGRVDLLRVETEGHRSELTRLTLEEQQSTLNRRRLEKELAEGEARTRNKRMRLNQVKTDKEMQAVAAEVETLKETTARLEAELIAMMEGAEARGPRIKELAALTEERQMQLTAAEKEIAAQVEDLKISIAKQKVDRDQMAQNIEVALLQRYEMIFSRRAGLAVSEARDGTCQGCRMRLPPQLFNELQKHQRVYYCPNCQRILYFEALAKE